MARTLWGNILETLAATGMNTVAKVGSNYLFAPLAAQQEGQQQLLKSLIPTMGTETDTTKLKAANDLIQQITGKSLATGVPETNPAGYEGIIDGSAITIPKSTPLEDLAPNVQTTPGYVRPPISLEQSMGQLISKMPDEEKQQVLGLKMGTSVKPIDALRLAMDEKRLTQQDRQYQQTQERMTQQFQQTQDRITQQNQDMQELRKQGLKQALTNQQESHGLIKDRLESSAMNQLQKGLESVQKVVKDPMSTEGNIKTAIDNYNAVHANIVQKYPNLANNFKPLDPELSTGWFTEKPLVGQQKVVGVKPREDNAPTSSSPTSTPTLTFPRRVKVNGVLTVVNSLDEYQALQKGLAK